MQELEKNKPYNRGQYLSQNDQHYSHYSAAAEAPAPAPSVYSSQPPAGPAGPAGSSGSGGRYGRPELVACPEFEEFGGCARSLDMTQVRLSVLGSWVKPCGTR